MKKMQGRPFVVIGVNTNGFPPASLKEVMQKEDIPWRTFADPERRISGAWNLRGTPTMYVVDQKGVIREFWPGNPGAARIEQRVEELVKEAEKVAAAPAERMEDRFAEAPTSRPLLDPGLLGARRPLSNEVRMTELYIQGAKS